MKSINVFLTRHWILVGLTFLTLISYASVLVSPEVFWPAGFLSHLIPFYLIVQILIMLVLAFRRKKIVFIPILLLLLGWPFLTTTLSLHSTGLPDTNSVRILSFNTKLFRKPGTYSEFSTDMIQWVANDTSDIKCIQEYSTNDRWPLLDVTAQIERKGYKGYLFQANVTDNDHNPGMAIFSKFEIQNTGVVFEDPNSLNGAIYADLLIQGKTLRIYNVHLASMNLELTKTKGLQNNFSKIKRLKSGSIKRIEQLKTLIAHTKSSPYPYIICGDFNETPYSYVYLELKEQFQNAFEETGNGFGFTFNEFPYLLRIDHQFYRSDIKAVGYRVNRTMNISDHFPTYGYYLTP